MSGIGSNFQSPNYAPNFGYGGASGGGENEDLKQERKKEARQSLIDSIEAFKITEKKKNIDAIR